VLRDNLCNLQGRAPEHFGQSHTHRRSVIAMCLVAALINGNHLRDIENRQSTGCLDGPQSCAEEVRDLLTQRDGHQEGLMRHIHFSNK